MRILRAAKLAAQNYRFKLWKWRNPGSSFKDYFADLAKHDLAQGKEHPSLGRVAWASQFHHFQARIGIRPDDVCVDYGCGTLRMGIHAIQFLNRGCYWGLDIDHDLLEQGRKLIGPRLEEKAPNLRVISPATISEAASAKPTLLFSLRVLIHVHPDELDEYIANILTIIGQRGRAIVTGKWSSGRTVQFGRQSWAHSFEEISRIVVGRGGCIRVTEGKHLPFNKFGRGVEGGAIEVRVAVA